MYIYVTEQCMSAWLCLNSRLYWSILQFNFSLLNLSLPSTNKWFKKKETSIPAQHQMLHFRWNRWIWWWLRKVAAKNTEATQLTVGSLDVDVDAHPDPAHHALRVLRHLHRAISHSPGNGQKIIAPQSLLYFKLVHTPI